MVDKQVITASGTGPVVGGTYAFKPMERSQFANAPEDDPKVLVVVPVIKLWKEHTRPFLDSVFAQELPDTIQVKVHLVDNGSTDETKEEAKKLMTERKDFHADLLEENTGCSPAWNVGIRKALVEGDFDYVMICNNDILLHPRAIYRLVERMEKKDNIAMATCMDVRGECVVPEDVFGLDDTSKEGVAESPNPSFSAFMVNREWLETVGEFDENFFPAYFEDNDMHYRIKLAGMKCIVYPPALFYHFGSKTQNLVPGGIVTGPMFEKNRQYFADKWGGWPGHETFTHPFNDENKSIKWTKQNQS